MFEDVRSFHRVLLDKEQSLYKLRLLGTSDTSRLSRFFDSLSPETKTVFRPYPFTCDTARRLTSVVRPQERLILLATTLVKGEEIIAGYAFVNVTPIRKNQGVFGIGLLDRFMGRGIASSLLHHVLALAAQLGCHLVWLRVYENNERARRLYEKAGFAEVQPPSSVDLLALRIREGLFIYGAQILTAYARTVRGGGTGQGKQIWMVKDLGGERGLSTDE